MVVSSIGDPMKETSSLQIFYSSAARNIFFERRKADKIDQELSTIHPFYFAAFLHSGFHSLPGIYREQILTPSYIVSNIVTMS